MRRRRKAPVTVDRKDEQTTNQIIDIISSNNSIVVNREGDDADPDDRVVRSSGNVIGGQIIEDEENEGEAKILAAGAPTDVSTFNCDVWALIMLEFHSFVLDYTRHGLDEEVEIC